MSDAQNYGEVLTVSNPGQNSWVSRRYAQDFARQLSKQSLPVPEMNLFPRKPNKINGNYYSPQFSRDFPNGRAVGISFKEASLFLLGHFSNDDAATARVMFALREVVKHIYRVRNLHNVIDAEQMKHPNQALMYGLTDLTILTKSSENYRERLSDGAALFYMLSNYQGDTNDATLCWLNQRIANVSTQYNTATTILNVLNAHRESPTQGLDLIECVYKTADIMGKQDLEWEQLITVLARSVLIDWAARATEVEPLDRRLSSFGNLQAYITGGVIGEAVIAELAFRDQPFSKGPLPQKTGRRETLIHRPRPVFG